MRKAALRPVPAPQQTSTSPAPPVRSNDSLVMALDEGLAVRTCIPAFFRFHASGPLVHGLLGFREACVSPCNEFLHALQERGLQERVLEIVCPEPGFCNKKQEGSHAPTIQQAPGTLFGYTPKQLLKSRPNIELCRSLIHQPPAQRPQDLPGITRRREELEELSTHS